MTITNFEQTTEQTGARFIRENTRDAQVTAENIDKKLQQSNLTEREIAELKLSKAIFEFNDEDFEKYSKEIEMLDRKQKSNIFAVIDGGKTN